MELDNHLDITHVNRIMILRSGSYMVEFPETGVLINGLSLTSFKDCWPMRIHIAKKSFVAHLYAGDVIDRIRL